MNLESGYSILAEGHIKEGRFEEALRAAEHMADGASKELTMKEIRSNAIKLGNLELYRKASRLVGLSEYASGDIAMMFLAAITNQSLDSMLEIIDLLPDGNTRNNLLTIAIASLASKGFIEVCEKLAEKRGTKLTQDEAEIIRIACIQEGWIRDAERAAQLAGVELAKDDYSIMLIANKDQGFLNESRIAAERAGIELSRELLISLLLNAIKCNRSTTWEIAELIEQLPKSYSSNE